MARDDGLCGRGPVGIVFIRGAGQSITMLKRWRCDGAACQGLPGESGIATPLNPRPPLWYSGLWTARSSAGI